MAAEATSAARWSLVIDGIEAVSFKDVSGFDSENEVIEWRESGATGNVVTHKVPGNLKWGNITCRRGVTDSKTLSDWRKQVEDGKFPDCRKNVTLTLYSPSLEAITSYSLKEAWPCKLKVSELDATKSEYIVEEVEICHIGMARG